MQWLKDRPLLLIALSCIPLFIINLGELAVNIMEARNFITAREMLVDNNWLLTTINGEPRYQKPPLPTWLTAFSGAIFGLKVWALRLPAALSVILLSCFGYKLSLKLTSNRSLSLIGTFILLTSFYMLFAGRNGQWDIFTHAFMMPAIYFIYKLFNQDNGKYKYALIAALFLGASFMSKGPVSMYALFLPFLIAYGIVYKFKGLKARIVPLLLMLLLTVIISGWWYWYTYTFDPQAVQAITERETSNWTSYNVRPFYYYWSFFTQSGIWTIVAFVALLYPYLKNSVSDKKGYTFSFLWTLASVVLLSVIPEKKSRYLLPVLIPMAWNSAYYIDYLILEFKRIKDWKEKLPVYFNFGLIGTIGIAFGIGGYFYLQEALTGYWIWFILLSVVLFIIGFLIWKNLLKKEIQAVFKYTVLFVMAILCFGLPMAKTLTINPDFKGLSQLHQWEEQTNYKVYEYDFFTPELIWDYQGVIQVLKQEGELTLPMQPRFGVLVAPDKIPQFKQDFKGYFIQEETRFDMNPKAESEGSYKTRLARTLFLVTKRD